MPSSQIALTAPKRAAARFIVMVRRKLLQALVDEGARGLNQSQIAQTIGVHRSVINRELRGVQDITLGRIGELAHAMGRRPIFELEPIVARPGTNLPVIQPPKAASGSTRIENSETNAKLKSKPATRVREPA